MAHKIWKYKAVVDRVIDGDTIDITVDVGFSFSTQQRIRLLGVDTPESYGAKRCKAGIEVKKLMKKKLEGKEIIIETGKTGKYGRYLGTIWLGNLNINAWLVKKGLGKEYFGGKR